MAFAIHPSLEPTTRYRLMSPKPQGWPSPLFPIQEAP